MGYSFARPAWQSPGAASGGPARHRGIASSITPTASAASPIGFRCEVHAVQRSTKRLRTEGRASSRPTRPWFRRSAGHHPAVFQKALRPPTPAAPQPECRCVPAAARIEAWKSRTAGPLPPVEFQCDRNNGLINGARPRTDREKGSLNFPACGCSPGGAGYSAPEKTCAAGPLLATAHGAAASAAATAPSPPIQPPVSLRCR